MHKNENRLKSRAYKEKIRRPLLPPSPVNFANFFSFKISGLRMAQKAVTDRFFRSPGNRGKSIQKIVLMQTLSPKSFPDFFRPALAGEGMKSK